MVSEGFSGCFYLARSVLEWHWDGMGWDVMAGGRDMVFTVVLG